MTTNLQHAAPQAPHDAELGAGADLVFVVGPETFTAHSYMLAKKSPQFAQYFISQPTPSAPITTSLPAFITPPSFESFLAYVYSDKYTPPVPSGPIPEAEATPPPVEKTLLYSVSIPPIARTTPSLLVELYRLAQEYAMEELKSMVAKDMVSRLNEKTVWEFRNKARECGVGLVIDMAEAFIKKNGLREGEDGSVIARPIKERRQVKRIARRFSPDGQEL